MDVTVVRIESGEKKSVRDSVADESFLTIYLDGRELLTLLCSPHNIVELSVGFLYSAGLIHSVNDIDEMSLDAKNSTSNITLKEPIPDVDSLFKRVYTSGCGKGMLFYNAAGLSHKNEVAVTRTLSSGKISSLMKEFLKQSNLFNKTGCEHSTALSDGESILSFFEDIGRHNALDKVIGDAVIRRLNMRGSIVLTTGRISSEMMYKVQKLRAEFIVSRSAPTALSVRLAEKMNITLVGFARGKRMNVYTATERVI